MKNKKKGLVTTGPYKWIRNPQYFLIILFISLLNWHCLVNTSFNVILVLIWMGEIIIYIILARLEEISLRKIYPEEYQKYEIWAGRFFFKVKKFYDIIVTEQKK